VGGSIRIEAEHRSDALALMRSLGSCSPYLVQISDRRWQVRAAPGVLPADELVEAVERWLVARRLLGTTVTLDDGTQREVPAPAL
jgi:hypothetical protein